MTDERGETPDAAVEEELREMFQAYLPAESPEFVRPPQDVIDRFIRNEASREEVGEVRRAMVLSRSFRFQMVQRLQARAVPHREDFLVRLQRFLRGPIPGYALSGALLAFLVQDLAIRPEAPGPVEPTRAEPVYLSREGAQVRGPVRDVTLPPGTVQDIVLREPIEPQRELRYDVEILDGADRVVRVFPDHRRCVVQGGQVFLSVEIRSGEFAGGEYRLRLLAVDPETGQTVSVDSSRFRLGGTSSSSDP